MKTKTTDKLQIWELSLLVALCITLFTGLWAQAKQNDLAQELVRLHIVAESDSEEDQAVKLMVRDAVLEVLEPKLVGIETQHDAQELIDGELSSLTILAKSVLEEQGHECEVKASVATETFPTRNYDGFALPAGDYVSLRIVLGEGGGKNWWCVVFPPLCMTSVENADAFSELSEEDVKLIVTDENEYVLKFHIIEWFERVRQSFS